MGDNSVLIVEDDRVIAMCLESTLISYGYRVSGNLSSPSEALRFIKVHRPGAVLMAVSMVDDDNALGVAEYIKDDYQIPVVLLSTLTDYKLTQRARRAAMGRIVAKPFDDHVIHLILECIFGYDNKGSFAKIAVPQKYMGINRYGINSRKPNIVM